MAISTILHGFFSVVMIATVSAVTDRIKWSNEIVYDYDYVPATGFQKADLSIVSGIKWSF